MFGHDWQPGEGTVVDIRYSGEHGNHNVTAEPHFLMDVRPSSGQPFRAEVDELSLMLSFRSPSIGAVVKLECDPARKKARFIRSDPAINKKTDERGAKAQYEAELHGDVAKSEPGPGIPATGVGFPGEAGSVGNVQVLSGAGASEMLSNLFGPGGADAIAEMKARVGSHTASASDPTERLAKLRALKDSGILTEAEYETQRQKIIDAI